jgi:co-chaperonin GroES (HSP10)
MKYVPGEEDPKQVLLDALDGQHKGAVIPKLIGKGARFVLVATAPEPEKRSGFIMTSKTIDEGRFQGKIGLVLRIGNGAFKYDGSYEYEGDVPQIGDWVLFKPSQGWEVAINGVPCRWVDSDNLVAVVNDIGAIY